MPVQARPLSCPRALSCVRAHQRRMRLGMGQARHIKQAQRDLADRQRRNQARTAAALGSGSEQAGSWVKRANALKQAMPNTGLLVACAPRARGLRC